LRGAFMASEFIARILACMFEDPKIITKMQRES
jgi:hypothetical protein